MKYHKLKEIFNNFNNNIGIFSLLFYLYFSHSNLFKIRKFIISIKNEKKS